MLRLRKLACVSVALFAAFVGRDARANLIVNGDFESPVVPSGGFTNFAGGSSGITGWTVQGSDVNLLSTSYSEPVNGLAAFNAESGLQSLDLTGNANTGPTDGIIQSITTSPGTSYLVTFWVGAALSSNGASFYQGPATDDLTINGGTPIPFSSTPVNSGHVTWTAASYQFTATGSTTTIGFYNATALTTSEAGLDNVSVTAVPEPFSGTILAIAGIGLLSRRPRRN